jgi:hypothetical protein
MPTDSPLSRRKVLLVGTATTVATVLTGPSLALAATGKGSAGDVAILSAAYDLESQGIWAYDAAGGKLSDTPVGKMVLALARRNQSDHKRHRDALGSSLISLGANPPAPQKEYDLSTYIAAGEGGLGSDGDIARLALAIEIDAALAYMGAFAQLKNVKIRTTSMSIMPDEVGHAVAIRAALGGLMKGVEAVPSPFLAADTRKDWVLTS